jgi:ABC-type lipoprotein export system ATPase subunit
VSAPAASAPILAEQAGLHVAQLRLWHGVLPEPLVEVERWDVPPRTFQALVGVSGTGKTSLLMALAGLAPRWEGLVMLGTRLMAAAGGRPWRPLGTVLGPPAIPPRELGICFQGGALFDTTVGENLAVVYRRHTDMSEGQIALQSKLWLERVHLQGLELDRPVETLSGGQARRLALVRALLLEPSILLADEPTANVDLDTARCVLQLLLETARRGCAVIAATHDPLAGRYVDRIAQLNEGRLLDRGTPAEALQEALRAVATESGQARRAREEMRAFLGSGDGAPDKEQVHQCS